MRKWLYTNFNFTRREVNGLLVLFFLLMVVSALPAIEEYVFPEADDRAAAMEDLVLIAQHRAGSRLPARKEKALPGELFAFDPNLATAAVWERLGLTARQAGVMVKYKTKGGRFRTRDDLKKMFVISPEFYARVEPYVRISEPPAGPAWKKPQGILPVIVSLNQADTLELARVRGIGPAFSRRIARYRERLGGFYKKEQLLEVYGMDSLRYQEIKDQFTLEGQQVIRLEINTVTFEELKNHPYLSYRQINALLQYRKQHGIYGNIADLKKVAALPPETVEKLAPYISFNHDRDKN